VGGIFAILLLLVIVALLILRARHSGVEAGDRIGDGLRSLKAGKEQYHLLTREVLDETPDEKLVAAVLYNLWAKMDASLSDAHAVLSGLSDGRRLIFALYAVTGGVAEYGFKKVLAGPDGVFAEDCLIGLRAIGADRSADIFARALTGSADLPDDAYVEAFEAEDGRARMTQYIRDHADQFVDFS